MQDSLKSYFSDGISSAHSDVVGMEVETSFVDSKGVPITLETSQAIFMGLTKSGWQVVQQKGSLVVEIKDPVGNRVLYELGRQNIELSTRPSTSSKIVRECHTTLENIYSVAEHVGAYPRFEPILDTDEDLLVVPDERDATWIKLDGLDALIPLARISAVQFTIEVPFQRAIEGINNLGLRLGKFLADYPQDHVWRRYIRESNAGYESSRYGGPTVFADIDSYCSILGTYRVVTKEGLKKFSETSGVDMSVFIRSIWWYFRLRRYGDQLCIEVRPLARRADTEFDRQLQLVLDSLNL